jgi:hypothetical protein
MAMRTHAARRALVTAAALAGLLAGCGSEPAPDPDSPQAAVQRKIESAQADAKTAPADPRPLAALAKAHFQAAGLETVSAGGYNDKGKAHLRDAAQAWERYLAMEPRRPDTGVARLMAATYGPGALDEPKKALRAQQVLTTNTHPPNATLFAQLAQMAYYAGDARTGDLAVDRAVALTPKAGRSAIRDALATAREQIAPQRQP